MKTMLCLAMTALAACSVSQPGQPIATNRANYYAVTATTANFYDRGPAQANGPNRTLPRDTLLTPVKQVFGYCKVQLLDGEEGYVATEDIQPASSALVAQVTAPQVSVVSRSRVSSRDRSLVAPSPPLPVDPTVEPTPIPGTESSLFP